jgi:hypothetical protein
LLLSKFFLHQTYFNINGSKEFFTKIFYVPVKRSRNTIAALDLSSFIYCVQVNFLKIWVFLQIWLILHAHMLCVFDILQVLFWQKVLCHVTYFFQGPGNLSLCGPNTLTGRPRLAISELVLALSNIYQNRINRQTN